MPRADFELECHGSIWLLTAVTVAAQDWTAVHIPDAQMWGASFVVEHRFVDDIVEGIRVDGLTV
jgi:hypothetical protein